LTAASVGALSQTSLFNREPLRWQRMALLLLGWLLPQLLLHGSVLTGARLALPLNCLALPNYYLPRTAEYAQLVPGNAVLTDLILQYPFNREFAAREIRAGRFPYWNPYNFAGAPFLYPIFSPFEWLYFLVPRPATLAWIQLLHALTLAGGVYVFARKSLGLSFWAALAGSCCAPWCGYMVLWQGFPMTAPVALFPWLLTAVERTVRKPFGAAPPCLAALTTVHLCSGGFDVGCQVLLATGLYAVFVIYDRYLRVRQWRSGTYVATTLASAWLLGFLLAAPGLLPFFDYIRTGARMERRAQGSEERPPLGLHTLPETVLPDIYGCSRPEMPRFGSIVQLESAATAYAGLLATMFLAPLAFWDREAKRENRFWCFLAVLGCAWSLNLPGFVQILRLPGLNMFSHNRFTFATTMAVLVLAMKGMDSLRTQTLQGRRWLFVPTIVAMLFGLYLVFIAGDLPEPIRGQMESAVRHGRTFPGIASVADVRRIQAAFSAYYLTGAALCLLAVLACFGAAKDLGRRRWFVACVAMTWLAEMLWFASGHRREGRPELYYPRISALEQLAKAPPGRVLGVGCLPPLLNQSHGLWDVRGYDAVDPARYLKLIDLARQPGTSSNSYALTDWFIPKFVASPEGPKLSPVLDLLNLRYLIFRQPPPAGFSIMIHEDDYWVVENESALPRAFVPRNIASVGDEAEMLQSLSSLEFRPDEEAYVEHPLDLPQSARGQVKIVSETPTKIEIEADMQTLGLVVLADMWDAGWHATLDGAEAPITRVDLALRGVKTPVGRHRLVFSYEPASFKTGVRMASGALVVLACWLLLVGARRS
jgi:hypothetical protein